MTEEQASEREIVTMLEEAEASDVSNVSSKTDSRNYQVRRVTFRMPNGRRYALEGVRACGEKALSALYYETTSFIRSYRHIMNQEVA